MANQRLTKRRALELITPVVDNEVDEDIRLAFFRYIQKDEEVKKQYESALRIKNIVSDRCPVARAPEQFKKRIRDLLKKEDLIHSEPIFDMHCGATPCSFHEDYPDEPSFPLGWIGHFLKWGMIAAAVVVAGMLIGIVYQQYITPPRFRPDSVEDYAYQHFTDHNGNFIPPNISTASLVDAEHHLIDQYHFSLQVPSLRQTEFQGIVYSDFISGYKVPMLEYYLPDKQQYIYIFVFRIRDLSDNQKLKRDSEAVAHCVKPGDFSICKINGMHIVSWKWDSTWYAGVSNQPGKDLIALIQSKGYEESTP